MGTMTNEKAKELLNNAFSQYNCGHKDKDRCECQSNPFALEQAVDKIFDEKSKYETELENTVKCLMGYVMELHDFQIGARKIAYDNKKYEEDDELKDFIIMKFPMLQGSRNHQTFRDLGKDTNWDDVGSVAKVLREKASKTD